MTYVNHFGRVECDKMSMGAILFTCPFNGHKVHHWMEDKPALAAEHYVAVECGACRSVHFVMPSTGKVMGENVRPKYMGTGPVGTT